MVGARSLAMALNRLIDREIDARNPRTAARELPSRRAVATLAGARVLRRRRSRVFLVAVLQLAHIVRWLWPIPVVGFVVYPYLKRFTWLCHLWLGVVDGLAAGRRVGRGDRAPALAVVGARRARSRSGSPASTSSTRSSTGRSTSSRGSTRGRRASASSARSSARASSTSRAVALLVAVGLGLEVGVLYWCGVAAVAALLLYEHAIVSPRDLRRLNAAFFTVNGVLSVLFFAFVLADATL